MSDINIQPEDQAVFDRLKSDGRITHRLRRMMTQQWNTCVSCGRNTPQGRPVFAGYDENKKELLVGACCSDRLAHLATPVYWTGTLNLSAPDSSKVWRYMDFTKFVAMLMQQGLYFTTAENFSDPFEGAIGLADRETIWDNYYLDFFRQAVTTAPPGYTPPKLSDQEVEAEAHRLLKSIKATSTHVRKSLVNCWHENDDESEVLWQLYSPPSETGLAIQSTVGNLWEAASNSDQAIVGRVHYLDFRKRYASIQSERIFCKRQSLSHEREIRIVLQNDRNEPSNGQVLKCELRNLIDGIVISPFAPSWFVDVLNSTIAKFGFEFDIRPSSINDEPFF
ncbi:hypothetical protein [Ruegeria lacuscaerulensis]|uniref:hypothetical protein n=1 Tax=Ruegeria lacuscaerulensis TaxID=55218 RepID=UPI00147BB950|nr:hypothetical protein [Ruegeria lacuscaerulensis]